MRDDQRPLFQFHHPDVQRDALTPFPVDVWTATSLLQKAVRRGETTTALRAAVTLHRWRGNAMWRRVMVIAVEGVGVASLDAAVRTVGIATDTALRRRIGDLPLLLDTVQVLAEVSKDRSTDLLAAAAQHHPDLEELRREIGHLPVPERIELAADPAADLPTRAVAAWLSCGIAGGGVRLDQLKPLLSAFAEKGVPDPVLHATWFAAKTTREPLCVMLPLLSLDVSDAVTAAAVLPASRRVGDVPLYAFDKHTRLGLTAISAFVRENPEIRKVRGATVLKPNWRAAVGMAVYYADATLLARRLRWSKGDEIERLGIEADFAKVGVPLDVVAPLCAAVAANLDHLDDIRERLVLEQLRGTP